MSQRKRCLEVLFCLLEIKSNSIDYKIEFLNKNQEIIEYNSPKTIKIFSFQIDSFVRIILTSFSKMKIEISSTIELGDNLNKKLFRTQSAIEYVKNNYFAKFTEKEIELERNRMLNKFTKKQNTKNTYVVSIKKPKTLFVDKILKVKQFQLEKEIQQRELSNFYKTKDSIQMSLKQLNKTIKDCRLKKTKFSRFWFLLFQLFNFFFKLKQIKKNKTELN